MTPARPPRPRLPSRAVWIDGRIVRGADAVLSVFDRGARDGGAIFETLRTYGGSPFAWELHMERLVLGAAELGFPVPPAPATLREAVAELLAAESLADAAVRITVTRGIAGGRPTVAGAWIDAEPIGGRLWAGTRRGAGTAIVSHLPFAPGWTGRYKTTSRMAWDLAREQARAAGVDETLLATRDGFVLEGAASNVFAVISGEVVTPPLDADVLPGITRRLVLERCAALGVPASERPLPLAALRDAEEAFVTNSLQEVLPLAAIDGRALPSRALGERLLAAHRDRVAAA